MKKDQKKGLGNKLFDKRENLAAIPLEVIGAGLFIDYKFSNALKSLNMSSYFFQNIVSTVSDATQGGPEGMGAAMNLEHILEVIEKATTTNKGAVSKRKDFVESLLQIYETNETVSRLSSRLNVNLNC